MSKHHTESHIQLREMPQLAEAVDKEDNWTGITDAALRRKRQNRLNIRAYHRQAVVHFPASAVHNFSRTGEPFLLVDPNQTRFNRIIFPLSSDHLITLLQFNALRGSLFNRELLCRLEPTVTPSNDACSSAALHVLPSLDPSSVKCLPPSLHPTTLQRTIPHESWFDIIPDPVFRDNLLRSLGMFDESQLWSDTIGGLFDGFPVSEIEQRGIILWSEPWHANGWEVSEGFWQKWSWALKGCKEILDATNRWGRERGDPPLLFEI
ncbi:hypothetical protein M501DRAFT_1023221 [Patellaria atrata CBS 101060]|uniref:Uncharacterized protein n=1 Tax=Patellaria atrata CBS 101060 TaxID=1346257 RepID=A0A9P4VPI2_9PEZI|nr:hypothetical protein M501DRAFT_1023221 [Patellaria atrata CBS 101060]